MPGKWAGNTFGNGWMHSTLIRLIRITDPRLFYLFTAVFVAPACVMFRKSGRTAYRYFRDAHGYGRLKALWADYINHCRFAEVVIDRFAMYSGKRFNVEVVGAEHWQKLAERPEGFLQMSSHIGNYEIAGYSLVCSKCLNAVVYAYEKESVMAGRNSMFSRTNIRMIGIREDMSHLFEIDRALSNGEVVSFPTDRFMGQARCLELQFFGRPARFPQGPFSVATMRGLDVVAVNVMKEGWSRYVIYVTPLSYDKQAPRKTQIRQLSEAYVAELEAKLRQYPEQWYNFYDFWS